MRFTDAELESLYARYAPVVYHRCRSILGNDEDARDALQETFAKVIVNAEDFRAQSSPLTWMYSISTHHCLNLLRNRKTRARKLEAHGDPLTAAVSAPEEGGPDTALIRALLTETDEQTRAILIHTWFDDCTREETARLVGLSVPTVRKRLQSFLDHARGRLALVSGLLCALLPQLHAPLQALSDAGGAL